MPERIPVSTFYAVNRGGGLHSTLLNQQAGALAAQTGARIGLRPSTLTLANLILGAAAAAAFIALAPTLPDWGSGQRALAALGMWILFQSAYSMDCGDGQLARITGQTSPAGASLDILCDIIVQAGFVATLAAIADAFDGPLPAWQVALWGSIWMLTLVTSQLDKHGNDVSLLRTASLPIRVGKMVRDYGAQISAAALVLAWWPSGMVGRLWLLTAVNGLYLLVLIARTARRCPQPGTNETTDST